MLNFGKMSAQVASEKDEFLRRLNNSETYTRQVLAAMPGSQLRFRPAAKSRTFFELFVHIGEAQLYTASQGVKVKQLKFRGSADSHHELDAFLEASYAELRRAITKLNEEDLGQQKSFWDGPASVSRILAFTLDHVTHHRGQATVYLRIKGVKPPDYVGW